ncbi:MAG: CRISPR system precrRNA processing endoribonuclease RAMP protein Cas6 [Thermoanaerobaculia bacterium]|nr:CRISPR system precrRNA processing endoribonuclease RAMP protein Cas6 [Thermoanaerobaculia bacterium]
MNPLPLPASRRWRFRLRLAGDCLLPAFPGPELRGMVGQGLRRAFCVDRPGDGAHCTACPPAVEDRCPYTRLFAPRASGLDGAGEPARPFALDAGGPAAAPQRLRAGDGIDLALTLIGPTAACGEAYGRALAEAGRAPLLGRGRRAGFAVETVGAEDVEHDDWLAARLAALAGAGRLRLRLVGPLALRQSQRVLGGFDLDAFLAHALARLERLAALAPAAGGAAPLLLSPPELPARAVHVEQVATRRVAFPRRGRGGSVQPMEGIVGEAVLAGSLAPLLPLLAAAERFQVGRWTSFGFGALALAAGAPAGAAATP